MAVGDACQPLLTGPWRWINQLVFLQLDQGSDGLAEVVDVARLQAVVAWSGRPRRAVAPRDRSSSDTRRRCRRAPCDGRDWLLVQQAKPLVACRKRLIRHPRHPPSSGSWVIAVDSATLIDGNEIKRFTNGKCKYCAASQQTFDRGEGLETHAYAFIHTDDIKARIAEQFGDDMQFDDIIGNPPYQLDGGGFGTSAAPIYHRFVDQAKKLHPRLLTMIIPARWFAGGKGLDEFRESMLTDDRLRSIDDYVNASDVFPGLSQTSSPFGGFSSSASTASNTCRATAVAA